MESQSGVFVSDSVESTQAIAEEFAKNLTGGEVVLLNGDLGSGKTTFTQGLAKGLMISQQVVSPTFTIVKEYTGMSLLLYHIDMYRIEDGRELDNLGLEELFSDDSIVVIEWNKYEKIMSNKIYNIQIYVQSDGSRVITIKKCSKAD
ncbi:MAG TPA: tRNA (adenosine(37)-N6)-threonylcarbamoyltransferase complex ATPase subunit type 1 TsaE [Clostridia bacterium]|jgi:tRNA threonylcarbamoyladenosine biosynthesis protein TsaE|nr:tRNA (adenosine(37)-N6)-threonylcarbamoyltransferase complex ATPase subunit type 1 TsaE [Clostridia bacterium]